MDTKHSDWVRLTLTDKTSLAGTEYVTIIDGVNGPFRVTTKSLLGLQLSDIAQTWNASGTTFTGFKLNVTDTASAATSLLMDLQVGGTSKLKVSKTGAITSFSLWSDGSTWSAFGINPTVTSFSIMTGGSLGVGINESYPLSWVNTTTYAASLILTRDTANVLAQRNSTNSQSYRIYNTYTDSSNYERAYLRWNSNTFEIGTEAAGTGTARALSLPSGVSSTAYKLSTVTTDATTSRTLTAADNGTMIYFTSSTAVTVTTASGLGAGFTCTLVQGGAGQITVAQGASTTLVSYSSLVKSAGQYSVISAVCPIANTFLLAGNLV